MVSILPIITSAAEYASLTSFPTLCFNKAAFNASSDIFVTDASVVREQSASWSDDDLNGEHNSSFCSIDSTKNSDTVTAKEMADMADRAINGNEIRSVGNLFVRMANYDDYCGVSRRLFLLLEMLGSVNEVVQCNAWYLLRDTRKAESKLQNGKKDRATWLRKEGFRQCGFMLDFMINSDSNKIGCNTWNAAVISLTSLLASSTDIDELNSISSESLKKLCIYISSCEHTYITVDAAISRLLVSRHSNREDNIPLLTLTRWYARTSSLVAVENLFFLLFHLLLPSDTSSDRRSQLIKLCIRSDLPISLRRLLWLPNPADVSVYKLLYQYIVKYIPFPVHDKRSLQELFMSVIRNLSSAMSELLQSVEYGGLECDCSESKILSLEDAALTIGGCGSHTPACTKKIITTICAKMKKGKLPLNHVMILLRTCSIINSNSLFDFFNTVMMIPEMDKHAVVAVAALVAETALISFNNAAALRGGVRASLWHALLDPPTNMNVWVSQSILGRMNCKALQNFIVATNTAVPIDNDDGVASLRVTWLMVLVRCCLVQPVLGRPWRNFFRDLVESGPAEIAHVSSVAIVGSFFKEYKHANAVGNVKPAGFGGENRTNNPLRQLLDINNFIAKRRHAVDNSDHEYLKAIPSSSSRDCLSELQYYVNSDC